MDKKIDVKSCGRICIFGEHSDWITSYKKQNEKINNGYAIVSGIDLGISAHAYKSKKFCIKEKNKIFESDTNINILKKTIDEKSYYSYVCGVFYCLCHYYNIGGFSIEIYENTLPEKKGLSSSAAICVLIVRAANELYDLNLTNNDIMNIAYLGERYISKCGRMDQVCAYGEIVSNVEFEENDIKIKPMCIGSDFYLVYVDLNSTKNTQIILDSLNNCFSNCKTKKEESVINYLSNYNKKVIKKAIKYFELGDALNVGLLMNDVQKQFDKCCIPVCDELKAPKLHEILNDSNLSEYIYGGKLVGSGGDGMVQLLAKNKESQRNLCKYIKLKYNYNTYKFKISKTKNK